MTIVRLVCPQCRNQNTYEERNLDTSKEITCSVCGFSGLPTAFELAKDHGTKSWQAVKFAIIGLALIGFVFVGLPIIALAAFGPIIVAAVIVILVYRKWKEKKAR